MQPIPGYEDTYVITYSGDVIRQSTQRVLQPTLNRQNGYLYVSLWQNNQGRSCTVHRLVAQTFLPNPENKPNVNHKDSNRANPHGDNLEWCTQSENILHGYAEGFMQARPRFDSFELDVLLNAFLSGETMTTLATGYQTGLSRLTINLRKHAEQTGQLDVFEWELRQQKVQRNVQANAAKRRPITQHTVDGVLIGHHPSATAAARTLGVSSSGSICNALNPNHPQQRAFGFTWTYQ